MTPTSQLMEFAKMIDKEYEQTWINDAGKEITTEEMAHQWLDEDKKDYDPNDPESWDCSEEEYSDRMSHLANKAHEASEGER